MDSMASNRPAFSARITAGLWTLILFVPLLSVPLLSGGRASSGKDLNENQVSSIQKGVTTEHDLVSMFGQPEHRAMNSDGQTVLTWVYSHANVNGTAFIPVAGAFMGGTHSSSKSLTVTLQNDKVVSLTQSTGENETHHT